MKVEQILQEVRAQLGTDFVDTQVVSMEGLPIASVRSDPSFDESAVAARLAMAMKMARTVSEKLGLGDIDDNLVTTDKYMILSRFLGDHSLFWTVTVTKEATLGMVRLVMNEYAPKIWELIPH